MADQVALVREAARLMRQRAYAATISPWVADASEVYSQFHGGPWVCETLQQNDALATNANSAHIASWHPGVALFVADWLDLVADSWVDATSPKHYNARRRNQEKALAVARIYPTDRKF